MTTGGLPTPDARLVEMMAEVVHEMNEVHQLEIDLVGNLTRTVRDLAIAVADLDGELTSLSARVTALDHGAPPPDGSVIAEPVIGDPTGLYEQARQAQRHAHVLLERTEALARRATDLQRESRDVLALRRPPGRDALPAHRTPAMTLEPAGV